MRDWGCQLFVVAADLHVVHAGIRDVKARYAAFFPPTGMRPGIGTGPRWYRSRRYLAAMRSVRPSQLDRTWRTHPDRLCSPVISEGSPAITCPEGRRHRTRESPGRRIAEEFLAALGLDRHERHRSRPADTAPSDRLRGPRWRSSGGPPRPGPRRPCASATAPRATNRSDSSG